MSDVSDEPQPSEAREAAGKRLERSALIEQLGGVRGLVDGTVAPFVFVTLNILIGLERAVIGAVATGVVILALRLVRKQPVQQVLVGFAGLALAALIAAKTGRAEGFFLPGIVKLFAYAAALGLSVAFKRPLVGFALGALEGQSTAWRDDPAVRRIYARATLGWAAYMLIRGGVALALYDAGSPIGLLILRLSGLPLIVLGAALTVGYAHRALAKLPR